MTLSSRADAQPWPAICSALRRNVLDFLARDADAVGDDDDDDDATVVRATQARTRDSLAVISEALQRYGRKELSLSYNGGKDCLVLLILILACLPTPAAIAPSTSSCAATDGPPPPRPSPEPLQAIYIAPPDPFPEVDDFISRSTARYHLDLTRYTLSMREALVAYRADRPAVKAIFMGTRHTDPHSELLTPFSPTDGDWPALMRVNPVLDWHYPEIWTFIRRLDIPYCDLYDRGFTSLGGTRNTRPNPALALDGSGKIFLPAYQLLRDDEERLGRDG